MKIPVRGLVETMTRKPKTVACVAMGISALLFWASSKTVPLAVPAVGVFVWGLIKLLRKLESEMNVREVRRDFERLDYIAGEDFRYLGRESEMIQWRRCDLPRDPGPIRLAILCRTRAGRWFEFCVEVNHGRTGAHRVKPLTEADARQWLRYDVAKYEAVFGQVDVA